LSRLYSTSIFFKQSWYAFFRSSGALKHKIDAIGKVTDHCKFILGEAYLKGKNYNLPWTTEVHIDPMSISLANGTCLWVDPVADTNEEVKCMAIGCHKDRIKPYAKFRL